MENKKKNILLKMFDIRPTTKDGDLDFKRMGGITKNKRIIPIAPTVEKISPKPVAPRPEEILAIKPGIYQFGKILKNENVPVFGQAIPPAPVSVKSSDRIEEIWTDDTYFAKIEYDNVVLPPKIPKQTSNYGPRLKEFIFPSRYFDKYQIHKLAFSFASLSCVILLIVFGAILIGKGFRVKNIALNEGALAMDNLTEAKNHILNNDFSGSGIKFAEAYDKFDEISKQLNNLGSLSIETSSFIPYLSKLSSGSHLVELGKDLSKIGVLASGIAENLSNLKNPLNLNESISFLDVFEKINKNSREINALLENTQSNVKNIDIGDLSGDQQSKFLLLKEKLPEIKSFVSGFTKNSEIFTDVLGGNGPRKYLFLFQNNQEMRATGGFIGSYGVLDIFNGRVKNFFIDGIFNPDGQLKEKVIPPAPIQKISAAWSLHDSNWFPDFPVSAEKAIWFYEKTGGPTVDGVITLTPNIMQKLLEVTGPIDLPDYGLTIDSGNFLEKIQEEVEVNYDKELNQPKKVLADLAPILLDKIFNATNISDMTKALNILMASLNEKQILIYSKNYDVEKMISSLGWSGEVLGAQKDYLSVVNSNINGYKTDGVIDESISHLAEIQSDGSIIDTVTITRHHNGGDEKYEWWNKVNADYMRVYVPKDSTLISVEGQTREFNPSPLDYNALGFKHDAQVQMEEEETTIDQESGTRIYNDADKTVFANWVYVSPQETATITYKYRLPFKLSLNDKDKLIDTYSLLTQKQSGSVGSDFKSIVKFPENLKTIWNYPDNLKQDPGNIILETDLKIDRFVGIAFSH